MFEHYTETARRVIFFARYEASRFGNPFIDTEHLLLGLIREDKTLPQQMQRSRADVQSLRSEVESQMTIGEKIATSVDLPLAPDAKRALAYAAKEAKMLHHSVIHSSHLILGLLRIKTCVAAAALQRHGIKYAAYRAVVRTTPLPEFPPEGKRVRPTAWDQPDAQEPASPSLGPAITALKALLDQAAKHFDGYSDAYGQKRLKRKPWSRKEALGHLIDLATAHHQLIARALTESKVALSGYPQDDWVAAQQYHDFSWPHLVDLWTGVNRLLIHVLSLIPEEKSNTPCRIGIEEPIPLVRLMDRYAERCEDVIGQIVGRL